MTMFSDSLHACLCVSDWGAQAASLPFAAACREHSMAREPTKTAAFFLVSSIPPGKLLGGAGWQPALPSISRRVDPITALRAE
ncbi:MAG TPA: hypothetical protein VF626_05855 [Chthoniobacterales bacterium]